MKKICVQFAQICIIALLMVSCSPDLYDEYVPVVNRVGDVTVSIAKYDENRDAAVVLSFDDGTYEQYLHAVPALAYRGLTGTFFINGLKIKDVTRPEVNAPSSSDLRDMAERGFEVSNHTFHHAKLTEISLDSARMEMKMNDDSIEVWTGVRPTTFAFPYNARNNELIAIANEDRVGVRTFETGFGQTYRSTTYKDMVKWVKDAVSKHDFVIGMYHGIEYGYDYWNNPDELMKFWDYLVAEKDHVWTTTFRDVSSYMKARDNTQLVTEIEGDILVIEAKTNLDTTLYKYPLTVLVESKSISTKVKVRPGERVYVDMRSGKLRR